MSIATGEEKSGTGLKKNIQEVSERAEGMGCIPLSDGFAFRVWAPHASKVELIGTFNDWIPRTAMEQEPQGKWYIHEPAAKVGHEYRFRIHFENRTIDRIDPWARQVTNSVGAGVIPELEFDWQGDERRLPSWNEAIIYEMHIGTFARSRPDQPGKFEDVIPRLRHLRQLGVNCLQIMPAAEFAGDVSWGYNPAHIFAIESAYGGPRAFKEFIREAHRQEFAIILDVVYNHFGPSDIDLWQFDGWSENGRGGIYFYNDDRAATPWGETRPDYGRGEVRQFIRDNALMWLDEYHVDGLRFDMTLFMRTVDGTGGRELPDGWGLTQWINREIRAKYPNALTIAEDLQDNEYLTKDEEFGGAGFSAQWDAAFVHPIRAALKATRDEERSMASVRDALLHQYNLDKFERVVYTESHDEVANGKSRLPSEIAPNDATNRYAQKRSTLGAVLTLTAPGIPMLFQGQEFLEDGWFQDTEALDWSRAKEFRGIVGLYSDLIELRKNHMGNTKGLLGQQVHVFHVNDQEKVVAYRRGFDSGPGDDVVIVINFSEQPKVGYRIGMPSAGIWRLRLNSDAKVYSNKFDNHPSSDIQASNASYDDMPASAEVAVGAYAALIYSQDLEGQVELQGKGG